MMKTRPIKPLKFKVGAGEIVFARDAVKTVELVQHKPRAVSRPHRTYPVRWIVKVNDHQVHNGTTEAPARKKYERALAYI